MKKTLEQHLGNDSPKRILALDGGGIRGALTLGYLEQVEKIIKNKHGEDTLLCDYFDLIGGTSTGSIIASALAIGLEVKEVKDKYLSLGSLIFKPRNAFEKIFSKITDTGFKAQFDHQKLLEELKKVFADITIGDTVRIKTGLCIMMKRADTNSLWPLINHPDGKYFKHNKNIPLINAIRASTAAPTYFLPEKIEVGGGNPDAAFVDGGVSMANNPALNLLMVATLNGFPFKWKKGEENIELVSIGTGYANTKVKSEEITDNWLVSWAKETPDMLMQDASWHNQTILQWMSRSPTAVEIDREMGDLSYDLLCDKPLLKYLRYNLEFTRQNLANLGLEKETKDISIKDLLEMSNANNKDILYNIGKLAGEQSVKSYHF